MADAQGQTVAQPIPPPPRVAAPPRAGKTTWNYNVWGPKRGFTGGIETAKQVTEAADSNFEWKIHLRAALSPPKQIPDSIKFEAYEAG